MQVWTCTKALSVKGARRVNEKELIKEGKLLPFFAFHPNYDQLALKGKTSASKKEKKDGENKLKLYTMKGEELSVQ